MKKRCDWGSDAPPDLVAYHDLEWGRPLTDEDALFERLCLEGFQAGLSWLTVLRKREAFRAAFHGFAPGRVARLGPHDIQELMTNAGIIRSRPKIEAAITNAGALLGMHAKGETLAGLMWSHAPKKPRAPRTRAEVPAVTDESTALAKALKKRGFRFVGPTTVYAMMQATGIVNDHLVRCFVRRDVERLRAQKS